MEKAYFRRSQHITLDILPVEIKKNQYPSFSAKSYYTTVVIVFIVLAHRQMKLGQVAK
jgi:hypothetical protein